LTEYFGRPLYLQIADDLRREILRGVRSPGSALPSITELVQQYETSTTTVRQAFNVLRSEGLTYGQQGKGTFVRQDRPRYHRFLGDLYGRRPQGSPMAAIIEHAGATPRWEHRSSRAAATPAIADRLRLEPGDPVMITDYTFLADDEPVMLSTSYEPLALTRGTGIEVPDSGETTGVIARFSSIGIEIDRVVEDVTARAPRPHESANLRVPAGVPVMSVARTYFAGDLIVETADIVVAADNYVLRYSIRV
jgi:DNA-binding GntR family transcriptional regulator